MAAIHVLERQTFTPQRNHEGEIGDIDRPLVSNPVEIAAGDPDLAALGDTSRRFWVELLREYAAVCDDLTRAA